VPYDSPPTTVAPRGGAPGEPPETPLLVRFPGLGRETTSITAWSIDSNYMTSTDGFEFTLYDENIENTRHLELQPVELIVNGQSRLIGRIDHTRRGDDGLAITCMGRDFIGDILECNVDPLLKIKEGDELLNAITTAAGPAGINAVFDDDGAMRELRAGRKVKVRQKKPSKKKKKLNEYKPMPGQGMYEFLNKISAREGVTLQAGPNRNTLVISSPNYDQDPLYRIFRTRDQLTGAHNNIESAVADRDFSKMPTYVIVQGAYAKPGQKGDRFTQMFDMWSISARFVSELGRSLQDVTVSSRWVPGQNPAEEVLRGALYRLLVIRDDDARSAEQIEKSAKRAIAERMKDTLEYRVTLKGHIAPDSGALYSQDTMIQVDDEIADLHEVLWVAGARLSYKPREGPKTDLVCWRPESFLIDEPYQPGDSGPPKKKKEPEKKPEDKIAPLIDLTGVARDDDEVQRKL